MPTHAIGDAEDTAVMDVVAVELDPALALSDFVDLPFDLHVEDVVDCEEGDVIYSAGYPRELCDFSPDVRQFHLLQMEATVEFTRSKDRTLRSAITRTDNPELRDLRGISGAPVCRLSDKRPCGMIVRAGVEPDGHVHLHFVELSDVVQVLLGGEKMNEPHIYQKNITVRE